MTPSWLTEALMAEELPSGDRAVLYVFIEMIALWFVLYSIEEAFKDKLSWAKVGAARATLEGGGGISKAKSAWK